MQSGWMWRLCIAPIVVLVLALWVSSSPPARAIALAPPSEVPTPRVVNSIDFTFDTSVSALAYDPVTGHELAFGNYSSLYTLDARTGKRLSTINPYQRDPFDPPHDAGGLAVAARRRVAIVGTEMGDLLLVDLHHDLPRRWKQLSVGQAPVTVLALDEDRDAAFVGIGPAWAGTKGASFHPFVVSLATGTLTPVSSVSLRGLDIVTQIVVDSARARVLVLVDHQRGSAVNPQPGPSTAYLLDAATMGVISTWTTSASASYTDALADGADGVFVLQSAHACEMRDTLTGVVRARIAGGGGYVADVLDDRLVLARDNSVDVRDVHTGAPLSHVAIPGSLYQMDTDAARDQVFVWTLDAAKNAVFSFVDVGRGALTRRLSYVDASPIVVQYVPSVDRIFMSTETFKNNKGVNIGYEHLLTLDPTHTVMRPLPSCGCPRHG